MPPTVTMDLEASLNVALRAWVPLVASRVRPLRLPSGQVLPALVFFRVGGFRDKAQTGTTGLADSLFQIDVWAWDYAQVKAVAREVRLGIVRHPRQTPLCDGGPLVCGLDIEDDTDDFELSGNAYRVIMQVHIWHQEET